MASVEPYTHLLEYYFTYAEAIDLIMGEDALHDDGFDASKTKSAVVYYYLEQLENIKANNLKCLLALNRLCIRKIL